MKKLTTALTLVIMAVSAVWATDYPEPEPNDPNYFSTENNIKVHHQTTTNNSLQNSSQSDSTNLNSNSSSSTSEGSSSYSNTTNDLNIKTEGDNTYNFTLPEVANDHYGNGVSCAKPTIGGGVYGDKTNEIGGFLGFSIPLNGKTCNEVSKLRKQEMIWEAREKAAQRVKLCKMMHHSIVIEENADEDLKAMHQFCDGIKIIHTPPPKNYPEKQRVSSHVH